MKYNRIFLAFIVFAIASMTIESCKKGPEDPGISFKGRNGRLYGTWTMKSLDAVKMTYTYSRNLSNDVNDDVLTENGTQTINFSSTNGTSMTISSNISFTGDETHDNWSFTPSPGSWQESDNQETYTETTTASFTVGYKISIYEDGTYTFTRTKNQTSTSLNYDFEVEGNEADPGDLLDDDDNISDGSTYKDDITTSGIWYWNDEGAKEGEKKVILVAGPLSGYLVRLSSKDLKLEPTIGLMNTFLSNLLGSDYSSISFGYNPYYNDNSFTYGFDGFNYYLGNNNNSLVDESQTLKNDVTLSTHSNANPSATEDGVETDAITEKVTVSGGISTWEKTDKESKRAQ